MLSFRDYHPTVSLVYFIYILVLSMMTRNPLWVIFCFSFAVIYVVQLHGVKNLLRNLISFLPMLILIVFINSYFNSLGLTVLFYLGRGNPITVENIFYGIFSAFALFTVFLWFSCYNALQTSDEILTIFGKRLPTIGLTLSMILKYIPETVEKGSEISLNQRAMLGQKKLNNKQRLKFASRILTVLLSWSMENSLETADSMLAKGYPSANRNSYSRNHFNKRDFNLILLFSLVFILHLITAFLGPVKFEYYPYLRWSGAEANVILLVIAIMSLSILLSLPLLIDLSAWFKWTKLIKREENAKFLINNGIVIYEQ